MVIRFIARAIRQQLNEDRLETHPSGLNRTDARRLSRREIEHRERMLAHLQRLSVTHFALDGADDAV
jgi:hypothetical protein